MVLPAGSRRWLAAPALLGCVVLGCSDERAPTRIDARTLRQPGEVDDPVRPEDIWPDPPPPRSPTLELSFVGDIVLGRFVGEVFVPMQPADADPFAAVAPLLAADVVVGNLESPAVIELPPRSPIEHEHRFGTEAAYVGQLARAGFSILSLANNHHDDLGIAGQLESPRVLAEAGLRAIGGARLEPPLLRIESLGLRGWRIGLLAVSTVRNRPAPAAGPQLPYAAPDELGEQAGPILARARADHDVLIVVVHWGAEYVDAVLPVRREAARAMLDAGADLIVGHHPHVLQAIERVELADDRDGLIAYSLGNFSFPRNRATSGLGAVLRIRYRAGGAGERACLEQARVHPTHMLRSGTWQVAPATGRHAERARARLVELSAAHATELVRAPADPDGELGEELLVDDLRPCPGTD